MESGKITKSAGERGRRLYDDACGTAHALDLVGERWALLVVRELLLGPKRFGDLRADLPGLSANVLTQRLEGLEASGLVARRKLPPPAGAQVYELTEWGYEAEPIFQALGRWAARSPSHDPSRPFSAVSLMLSLRTLFDTQRAGDIKARIGFRLGAESFVCHVAKRRVTVARAPAEGCDLIFAGAPAIVAGAIYGGLALEALEAEGALTIEGDRALAGRFVTWFPLPAKAPPAVRRSG